MRRRLSALSLLLLACGTPSVPDASVPYVPTQTRALGLNDVTWLLPLEPPDAGSPFGLPVELIPFSTFERLTTARPVVRTDLSRLRVVALRFDLCDRSAPGACPAETDGVFRLVLQPVFGTPVRTEDVALHAFYAVPHGELPRVVDELRALAAIRNLERTSVLDVNRSFATNADYRTKLAALVTRYAKAARLHRLTLFGQESDVASLIWIFRGEQRGASGALEPIRIPGIDAAQQEVTLYGGDSYFVSPLADAPAGFSRAMLESSFRNATAAEQLESVKALVAVDNPNLHTSDTVQCVSCHATTTLLLPRAQDAGVDVESLPELFPKTIFDAAAIGEQTRRVRTLRALGYIGEFPLTTFRVVNETAHVVEELEARYPPAP